MPPPTGERMPADPDPMTSSETHAVNLPSRTRSLKQKPLLAAIIGTLSICLAIPGTLRAGEPASHGHAPVRAISVHDPATSTETIRIRLHAVEHLGGGAEHASLDRRLGGSLQAADLAEELKKQAQAAYLAAKLRKREAVVRKYVDLAWEEARKRDWLAPELLIAIMQKESSLQPKVQSRYGAQGLMQVVRRWHRDKLHPSESLFDPEVNIRVGADVLEEYLALSNGDINQALRKYSGNADGYVNTILKESRNLSRVAERAASKAMIAQG
jgi:hypothetical protein